jgi:hypothetical protein
VSISNPLYQVRCLVGIQNCAASLFCAEAVSISISRVTKCLAFFAEQCDYFTPAFIFENIARGPPDII